MSTTLVGWQRSIVRRLMLGLALVIGAGATGCTTLQGINEYIAYNDTTNDFVLGWRNRAWARQAWILRQDQFADQPYLDHFGAGFRSGYMDVAAGSNGCTPALPPRHYWSWKYQTAEGQGKVAAWFSGYPHGARAAEEDGAGNWGQIQVSETLRAEYRLGHEPPFNNHVFLYNAAECCGAAATLDGAAVGVPHTGHPQEEILPGQPLDGVMPWQPGMPPAGNLPLGIPPGDALPPDSLLPSGPVPPAASGGRASLEDFGANGYPSHLAPTAQQAATFSAR